MALIIRDQKTVTNKCLDIEVWMEYDGDRVRVRSQKQGGNDYYVIDLYPDGTARFQPCGDFELV